MNLIRLDDFEANLRFQVASVEIFEDHHKTFETGNRLSDFTVCESKDSQSDSKNDSKPLKPIRT
jgi:hypothetical protein